MTGGVTAISAGGANLAIKNGTAYAWGDNSYGEAGQPNPSPSAPVRTPMQVGSLNGGVTAIAAGGMHSLAIQSGIVWAWGFNESGQLGNGTETGGAFPAPRTVSTANGFNSNVTAIAAGGDHSLAIQGGTLWAWGPNAYGQVGNDTHTDQTSPVPITSLGNNVTAIAAGGNRSLAIVGGGVYAWGHNSNGQLGDGTQNDRYSPQQVDPADLHDIVAIGGGYASSYALRTDGTLWIWGDIKGTDASVNQRLPHQAEQSSTTYYVGISTGSTAEHTLGIVFVPPSTFFNGETYVGNDTFYLSFANSNYFGYYSFLPNIRYIYHADLGFEYVFDAADNNNGVYLYDFKSNTFFYSSPTFPFPYLYDFTLNSGLYYYPDPNNAGHYNTDGVRYFYNFATSQIITK